MGTDRRSIYKRNKIDGGQLLTVRHLTVIDSWYDVTRMKNMKTILHVNKSQYLGFFGVVGALP